MSKMRVSGQGWDAGMFVVLEVALQVLVFTVSAKENPSFSKKTIVSKPPTMCKSQTVALTADHPLSPIKLVAYSLSSRKPHRGRLLNYPLNRINGRETINNTLILCAGGFYLEIKCINPLALELMVRRKNEQNNSLINQSVRSRGLSVFSRASGVLGQTVVKQLGGRQRLVFKFFLG